MSKKRSPTPCPCGLNVPLEQCCGRYHAGQCAPDATALMRSRYSAYVLSLPDYLLATWHPSTRPASLDLNDGTQWLGLSIQKNLQKISDNATLTLPDHASSIEPVKDTVEFTARYKINGRACKLHEVSRFVQENGHWYYLDGDINA